MATGVFAQYQAPPSRLPASSRRAAARIITFFLLKRMKKTRFETVGGAALLSRLKARYHKRYSPRCVLTVSFMIKTLHDTVSLTNLTVLSVSGPDAASFLQSQFTQDMSNADPQRALLAAYCSPRGRVLATMVVVPPAEADNAFLLLVRTDIAD